MTKEGRIQPGRPLTQRLKDDEKEQIQAGFADGKVLEG